MDVTPQFFGYPSPPNSGPSVLPPGGGRFAVPTPYGFQSFYNAPAQVYRWAYDQALANGIGNALAMRNDPVIYECLRARQIPCAALSWHIDPDDDTDPAQVEAAEAVSRVLKKWPRWQQYRRVLLEAGFYGRYAVQQAFTTVLDRGRPSIRCHKWVPVNGDKLRFKFDGTVGIQVHALYPGEKEVTDHGFCHFLTPPERDGLVVHRFEPEDADFTQANFGGQVEGVGLRSRLYWPWWLKMNVTGLLLDYLQRFSQGLTLWKFPAHNPDAEAKARQAAADSATNPHVFIPVWTEQGKDEVWVERLEVGTASPALLQSLVTQYYDGIFRLTILGQELSSTTAPTGLGSGVAEAHMETLSRIVKYDAIDLDDTLNAELIPVLYRWVAPGVTPGQYASEVDEPNVQEVLGNAQILQSQFNAAIDTDHLMDIAKLPKPTSGSQVSSQMAPGQPAAVQGVPQGVPVVGRAGPATQPQQQAGQPEYPLAYSRRRRRGRAFLCEIARKQGIAL